MCPIHMILYYEGRGRGGGGGAGRLGRGGGGGGGGGGGWGRGTAAPFSGGRLLVGARRHVPSLPCPKSGPLVALPPLSPAAIRLRCVSGSAGDDGL